MKKIAFFNVIIFTILIFVGIFAIKISPKKDIFSLCNNYQNVTIVSYQNIDCPMGKISNGNIFYYTFENADYINPNIKAQGYVFHFSKDTPLNYFQKIFGTSLTSATEVSGSQVFYAFTPKFSKFVLHKNKKVNAQLAQTQNGWLLGFPLILTGF